MANENPNVIATDDAKLAKELGFTNYDESTGQWVKTPETVEEVEQYAADEREQSGEVSAHATGTVTPGADDRADTALALTPELDGREEDGPHESGDEDGDEVDDDEDHPAV